MHRGPTGFAQELEWMRQNRKGDSKQNSIYKLSFAATLYNVRKKEAPGFFRIEEMVWKQC